MMRTATGLLCLGLLVATSTAEEQPKVHRWFSNPADGCDKVDCASFTTKRLCARLGKNGDKLFGNAGCCQWDDDAAACSDRPCSWFGEENCNAAPHCGWSRTPDGAECVDRRGCTLMFQKTCEKFFQYCRWRKGAGENGEDVCKDLPIPTPERVADDTACFGMGGKACKWWMNHGSKGKDKPDCVWTGKWGCESLETINTKCWWIEKSRCEGAVAEGYECNWNSKLQKCTVYKKLPCYDLVGWTPENAMTVDAARRSCCADTQIGEQVPGAFGTTCTKPKLGKLKYNDCRWCEDHEESPRCVKSRNCPYNGALP